MPTGERPNLQVFFSGLYSESYFDKHQVEFFSAVDSFWHFYVCLASRLYLIVLLASLVFNFLITQYGQIRRWVERSKTRTRRFVRWFLLTFILPRVSDWHVVLSPMLLPSKQLRIYVDVLTKSGILYSGALADKVIKGDGDLQSLTLANPRRFRRDEYLKAKEQDAITKAGGFWTVIPGELFVVMGGEISTLNVRHVPEIAVPQLKAKFADLAVLFQSLQQELAKRQTGEKQKGV